MKISVFGIGYVGAVSCTCLAAEGHEVVAVDINEQKVETINGGRAPIVEAGLEALIAGSVQAGRLSATSDAAAAVLATELSIVCVGTPSQPNGNLDLGPVTRVCERIGETLRGTVKPHVVVVRSTMLPGSVVGTVIPALERGSGKPVGDQLRVAYYPEFMREGTAVEDYYRAGLIVFGISDNWSLTLLHRLTEKISGTIFVTDYATAEAAKYVCNAWHAAKIVFANEIGIFCKANGIDGHRVLDILCTDRKLNVSAAYLKPGFAYGGSCLPKDLRALQYKSRSVDLALPLLESLAVSNLLQVRRVYEMVRNSGGRRVGILGLSFKGGTDDTRESPLVELAELLLGKGYHLKIFDCNINMQRLVGTNLSFILDHIPHLSNLLAPDVREVIDFADVVVAGTREFDHEALSHLRERQLLIDLVRLDRARVPARCAYEGVGW